MDGLMRDTDGWAMRRLSLKPLRMDCIHSSLGYVTRTHHNVSFSQSELNAGGINGEEASPAGRPGARLWWWHEHCWCTTSVE